MATADPNSSLVASVLCAPLLDGPLRSLRVVHRSASACQLADDAGVVRTCAVSSGTLRFPHSVVLPQLPSGPALTIGTGKLDWGGVTFAVTRWWRPARPLLPSLRSRVREGPLGDRLPRWRDRLGEGPGLTPYADDVLCGTLTALRAASHPAVDTLAAAVMSTPLERYTTATSAALLRLAAEGWCIDPVAEYLRALATSTVTAPAARALGAVGSSSGRGLIEGITAVIGEAPVVRAA